MYRWHTNHSSVHQFRTSMFHSRSHRTYWSTVQQNINSDFSVNKTISLTEACTPRIHSCKHHLRIYQYRPRFITTHLQRFITKHPQHRINTLSMNYKLCTCATTSFIHKQSMPFHTFRSLQCHQHPFRPANLWHINNSPSRSEKRKTLSSD